MLKNEQHFLGNVNHAKEGHKRIVLSKLWVLLLQFGVHSQLFIALSKIVFNIMQKIYFDSLSVEQIFDQNG